MRVGVIGTGYVGLVQGIVLANQGLDVICMDSYKEKIIALNKGECPIYEPGIENLLKKCIERKKITFTTSMQFVVENTEVIFIAVGTPESEDGSADLTHILEAIDELAKYMDGYRVLVNKSTVPVGTGLKVKEMLSDKLHKGGKSIPFDIVSNPEFLREGKAFEDCNNPDRIVIGCEEDHARTIMDEVYADFIKRNIPIVYTDIKTAEMIKYASNAFLAVKISYINQLALVCEKVGANVVTIAEAMGMDRRISPFFFDVGPGYGGSCFPKDTKALVSTARTYGINLDMVEAAIEVNEKQKQAMVNKITEILGNGNSLEGKTVGVLGLSFKPETDDMREAPALDIIRGLVGHGIKIRAYCPEGIKQAKWRLSDISEHIKYVESAYEVSQAADAVVILTEWEQFKTLDYERIRNSLKTPILFDFRNMFWNQEEVRELFEYFGIGV